MAYVAPACAFLAASLAIAALGAQQEAVQQQAVRKLGVFFWHDSPNDAAAFAGIRAGLATAGIRAEFVERRADSDAAKATGALADLRAADCALVFAMGTEATLLAADAIRDRPVVFAAVSNPVASGIVADWDKPGRNVTGGSNWVPPATVLSVFQRAVPHLRRLGMLRSAESGVVSAAELAIMRKHVGAAHPPPIEIIDVVTANAADIPRAVRELLATRPDAIWIPMDFTIHGNLAAVRTALGDARVPLVTTAVSAARDAAVVGVTVDFELHGRRVAGLGLEILRGRDPATLPVDTMQSFLVVANLLAARRIGYDLPLSLLVLADVLIDAEAADGAGTGR
jgi:putative ABC transport system substrate-binding protein